MRNKKVVENKKEESDERIPCDFSLNRYEYIYIYIYVCVCVCVCVCVYKSQFNLPN